MGSTNGPVFFVMGVSGCGKSTIGAILAKELSLPFFDGDDFHSPANVSKMATGKPLNDADRKGWLMTLNALAAQHVNKGAVIVCSALKVNYRHILSRNLEDRVSWVLLDGTFDEILDRLNKRKGHFMPVSLLRSQFETLEKPTKAITVSIKSSPEKIVKDIISRIK